MKNEPLQILIMVAALASGACKTVPVDPSDTTPPVVKMDLYGVAEPGQNFIPFTDCCKIRRTVGMADELTLVASVEDKESGIASVEIVAVVLSECVVTRSFPRTGLIPGGPPLGQSTPRQTERVLASAGTAGGSASSLPPTRLTNVKTRLSDLAPEACGPIRFPVNDDPPTAVTIAEQGTTFCGVRVFTRAKNGVGQTHSTATGLLVEGPPNSGAFPCRPLSPPPASCHTAQRQDSPDLFMIRY